MPRREDTADATATENIELVRRVLDAVERGDRHELQALVAEIAHPDCEWTPLIAGVMGRSYRGADGLTAFFTDLLDSFEVRYADRDLRPLGDGAMLVLCKMELVGRESGVKVVQEMGAIQEYEDGLLLRGRAYDSHAEAITAAEALHA